MSRSLLTLLLIGLAACTDTPTPRQDIAPPAEGGVPLPEASFEGVDATGAAVTLGWNDLRRAGRAHALLVVTGGLWCGTCRWLAAPVEELVGAEAAQRLARLDVVLGDRDHDLPTRNAARAWQALGIEAPVAVDPNHRLAPLVPDRSPLPLVLLVETSSLTVVDTMANPTTTDLRARIAHRLGLEPIPSVQTDGFDENEWALLQTTTLPEAPPPSPTNPFADDPAAVVLGETLFFDTGLSPEGVACASCHQPEHHFHNGAPVAEGAGTGHRRVPSVMLAAHSPWQLWDGRASSLAEQALLPMLDVAEMGSSPVFVARRALDGHRDAYENVFGAAPDIDDWPQAGGPGDAAYDALPTAMRADIDGVFVRVGQAIAAWERSLRVQPNPLDAYLAGEHDALDTEQKYGLRLFVKHGCQQCHWGPRLTDDAFHNVGFPGRLVDGAPDPGRHAVLGQHAGPRHRGQFKTPPLRGVAHGAFFGHAGQLDDLSAVMQVYGWRAPEGASVAGEREPWLPPFGETAQWGMVPFLEVLTAERRN